MMTVTEHEGLAKARSHSLMETKAFLRYRGYDIAELAEKSNFLEVCLLLLNGELPTSEELAVFENKVSSFQNLPPEVLESVKAMPPSVHPMGSLAAGLHALGGACPHLCSNDRTQDIANFDGGCINYSCSSRSGGS